MNDLIIGAVTDYKAEVVMPWLNSIKKSGFSGKTALIIYNMELSEIEKLNAAGLDYSFVIQQDKDGNAVYDSPNFNICVERFGHLWYFLRKYEDEFDYVISTDVKDVIFQRNPSIWIRDNYGDEEDLIVVGTENIRYKDEPWGRNNLKLSFGPLFFEELRDAPIYCAGVVAGTRHMIEDFSKEVFLKCRGAAPFIAGGGGPDQAALNITIDSIAWSRYTIKLSTLDSFVAHCGTSLGAITAGSGAIGEAFVKNHNLTIDQIVSMFVDSDMIFDDGVVKTNTGIPYCIVHQYDRVPDLKKAILEKYKD